MYIYTYIYIYVTIEQKNEIWPRGQRPKYVEFFYALHHQILHFEIFVVVNAWRESCWRFGGICKNWFVFGTLVIWNEQVRSYLAMTPACHTEVATKSIWSEDSGIAHAMYEVSSKRSNFCLVCKRMNYVQLRCCWLWSRNGKSRGVRSFCNAMRIHVLHVPGFARNEWRFKIIVFTCMLRNAECSWSIRLCLFVWCLHTIRSTNDQKQQKQTYDSCWGCGMQTTTFAEERAATITWYAKRRVGFL